MGSLASIERMNIGCPSIIDLPLAQPCTARPLPGAARTWRLASTTDHSHCWQWSDSGPARRTTSVARRTGPFAQSPVVPCGVGTRPHLCQSTQRSFSDLRVNVSLLLLLVSALLRIASHCLCLCSLV